MQESWLNMAKLVCVCVCARFHVQALMGSSLCRSGDHHVCPNGCYRYMDTPVLQQQLLCHLPFNLSLWNIHCKSLMNTLVCLLHYWFNPLKSNNTVMPIHGVALPSIV